MENNSLDALLEDLQSSVARTAQMNGPSSNTRGYREVTRTVHTEGGGMPPTSAREYQIEYLTPANSTTIISERSSSPGLPPPPPELLNHDAKGSSLSQSYKTVSYENYKTSSDSSNAALLASAAATTNAARQVASLGKDASRLRSNINELDNLLDDLNASQRQGYTSRKEVMTTVTRSEGSSGGPLPPPLEDPVPLSAQHVSRAQQRSFSEQRYGSIGRQSPSPHRYGSSSLDRATASPLPKRSSSGQRDIIYSTSRSGSPSGSPAPGRSVVHKEVYRYESKSSSGGGGSTRYREPSPGPRPPSPTLERITNTVRNYDFNSSSSNVNRSTTHRPPSPASYTPGKTIHTSTTYNYNSSSSSGRPEPPRTPPPHRSPSPVTFPQPPEPHGVPFGYSQSTTTTTTRHRSRSPVPYQKFSPSDPSSGGRLHTYQLTTQKYSSQQHQQEQSPLLPRPFPTPSPDPGEQRPPKQLDELMSSFETDSTQTSVRQYASSINAHTRTATDSSKVPAPPAAPATPPPPPPPVDDRIQTRNVAGPPVYYPPGVDMFSKKEETLQFAEGGGKYKGKAKAKYEYESKSKMKEKSSQGGAVVPVCLPLCCAMPCTIM